MNSILREKDSQKKKENKKHLDKKIILKLVKEIPRLETSVNNLGSHLFVFASCHPHAMECLQRTQD